MAVVKQTEMVLDFVQYSVDEFFGTMPDDDPTRLRGYLQKLKDLILQETDIPVSCGAGESYTLAKTATHFAKKYPGYRGICIMPAGKREKALSILPVEQVWGIGRRRVKDIKQQGIQTALDFAHKDEHWIHRVYGVTAARTWKELNGIPAITLADHEKQKSIMYSRTFAHMTSSREVLKRELSNYASAAARRLRNQNALCKTVSIFLATNRHREDMLQYYNDDSLRLSTATDDTTQIISAVDHLLGRIFKEGYQYKQAGVILSQLQHSNGIQLDLFSPKMAEDTNRHKRLMKAIDGINSKFGSNQIHFAIQGHDAQDEQMAGFMRPHKIDENTDE
jgi:DNA polymerase V